MSLDEMGVDAARRSVSAEIEAAAQRYGEAYGVPGALHPDDHLFWFIHDQPVFADKAQAVSEYFKSGQEGAAFVKELLAEYRVRLALDRRSSHAPVSLLEFASGYGRVTRHFRTVLPDLDVTACDIHLRAVAFLQSLGLAAQPSAHEPEALALGRRFDVIFAFSFFTHMPRLTWTRWLQALDRHLQPNGLLIFSTHGTISQDLMSVKQLEPDGFFFHAISEQKDLSLTEYGNSVTTFDFVFRQIQETDLRLLQFREAGAGHHDLYILVKDPGRAKFGAAETDQLRAQISALRASRSWRITAPLRALSRAVAGEPKRR